METRTTLCGSLFALVVLAFFMPFFELRCGGEPASVATGYELAAGQLRGPAPVERSGPEARQPWLLALPLLAVAGAALAFLAPRAGAGRARRMLVGAAVAGAALVVLVALSYLRLKAQVADIVRARSAEGDALTAAAAQAITIHPRMGWYAGLLAATGAALLARFALPAVPAPGGDEAEAGRHSES